MNISADAMTAFATEIFVAAGSAPAEAKQIAEHLVAANLTGHDSHGVGMIPRYMLHRGMGAVHPNRAPKIVADMGALIVYLRSLKPQAWAARS